MWLWSPHLLNCFLLPLSRGTTCLSSLSLFFLFFIFHFQILQISNQSIFSNLFFSYLNIRPIKNSHILLCVCIYISYSYSLFFLSKPYEKSKCQGHTDNVIVSWACEWVSFVPSGGVFFFMNCELLFTKDPSVVFLTPQHHNLSPCLYFYLQNPINTKTLYIIFMYSIILKHTQNSLTLTNWLPSPITDLIFNYVPSFNWVLTLTLSHASKLAITYSFFF